MQLQLGKKNTKIPLNSSGVGLLHILMNAIIYSISIYLYFSIKYQYVYFNGMCFICLYMFCILILFLKLPFHNIFEWKITFVMMYLHNCIYILQGYSKVDSVMMEVELQVLGHSSQLWPWKHQSCSRKSSSVCRMEENHQLQSKLSLMKSHFKSDLQQLGGKKCSRIVTFPVT